MYVTIDNFTCRILNLIMSDQYTSRISNNTGFTMQVLELIVLQNSQGLCFYFEFLMHKTMCFFTPSFWLQ
jgi:hypothetical protein